MRVVVGVPGLPLVSRVACVPGLDDLDAVACMTAVAGVRGGPGRRLMTGVTGVCLVVLGMRIGRHGFSLSRV